MTDQVDDFEKPVPYWVGLTVAVALFGSLALGGLYWVWDLYTTPSREELVEVPAIPQARISLSGAAAPQAGVQKAQGANGQITYTVRTPEAAVAVSKSNVQPNWSYTFGYNKIDLIMDADQTAAANARFRLMSDPGFARSYKVNDDQVAKLKEVPAVATMIVSPADQAVVKAAFEKYASDPNSANEQALIKALGDTSTRSLAATRATVVQRVQQIQAILTPDQIKPFRAQ